MEPASGDDAASVADERCASQAVCITVAGDDGPRFLLATSPAGLPETLQDDAVVGMVSLDAFDTDAQLVIAQFLNVGWFSLDDVRNYVARVPTARGAGRADRRRQEREDA